MLDLGHLAVERAHAKEDLATPAGVTAVEDHHLLVPGGGVVAGAVRAVTGGEGARPTSVSPASIAKILDRRGSR